MVINHFGEGCFRLQSGEISLLVDPESSRLKADVVLRTIIPANLRVQDPKEIVFPGEYEVSGFEIEGWPILSESTEKFLKTIYLVRWENIAFAFLGHISKPLDPELIAKLDSPDVVFLPLDGEHFLSVDEASKIVKQLNPHFVIPSFSKKPEALLKAFGQKMELEEKLVFKKKDLAQEHNKIVVLKAE